LHNLGAIVTGIDMSSAMIAAAKAAARQQEADIAFIVRRPKLSPSRRSASFAVTILCFVQNAEPVFAEIARVLNAWRRARDRRAWEVELVSSSAPHPRVARPGILAAGTVPDRSRAPVIGPPGRSRSRPGTRRDLLSALGAGGAADGPLG
jgi:SAM-dependent methyltransferase